MSKEKIKLRELRETDVDGMLEWMHDKEVQKGFRKPMLSYTRERALDFIRSARYELVEGANLHFAIVNEDDEYMGTISLKNFDLEVFSAEYAIVLRKKAQGMGYAKEATLKLLEKGFQDYNLERIYLNVLAENGKAQRLYERCGFVYEGEFRKCIRINDEYRSLKWYSVIKEEYKEKI